MTASHAHTQNTHMENKSTVPSLNPKAHKDPHASAIERTIEIEKVRFKWGQKNGILGIEDDFVRNEPGMRARAHEQMP